MFFLHSTALAQLQAAGSSSVELTLIRDLLDDYDVNALPVLNASNPVVVEIGFALHQIVELVRTTDM